MTTILPAARTPWQVIDQAIGNQISQNLPGAIQQGYQRGQGLGAIDRLQSELQGANGDISKILPAIARAYTLNPSLERSGIAEKFIPLVQRQQGAQEFPAGQGQLRGPSETSSEGKQVPVSVSDLVPPRPSMVQNPQGLTDFQLPYGPEDIANIRQQARQKAYLPEMEERFVNDALEYNKIAENKRNAEISNYNQQQQERRDTLENQKLFTNYLRENSPEFATNPDELELALKASEKYQKDSPSFADRLAKVKNEIRPYQAAKKALEKTLSRPLFGQTPEQRSLSRPRAQMMVEMGQKPQLQLMIAKGGNGEAEEADLLNPLPQNIEKRLSTISNFTNPLEVVKNVNPDSPEYTEQLSRGSEMRLKQKNQMVDYLSKEITPGADYSHPGTNILLVRKHLMDHKATWEESAQIIDDAISKGKIKLDPQQKIDHQKLAYPPLTGDSYFDTVMNNLMFPITGKQ